MKRIVVIAAICLVVVMAAAVCASADPNWTFVLQATSGGIANTGNFYIGVNTNSIDGKDANDAFHPSMPDPNVQFYEMRNDWVGGNKLKSDLRMPYSNGTKVWSNLHVYTNYDIGETITVRFDPGEGIYAPPAGTYTLIDITGGVSYDMMNPDPAQRTFDMVIEETGIPQREFRAICTVGTGPTLYAAKSVTTTGSGSNSVGCAPVVDEDGIVYFGSNLARKIYKLTPGTDPVSGGPTFAAGYLTAATNGNVIGRMAYYNNYLYGVTSTGYVVKRNKAGTTTGNFDVSLGANAATPAVTTSGEIYVGCGNFLKRLNSGGAVTATSPDLGGPAGSPSIPGTDLVWVNAGSKLFCLSSNLATIRAASPTAGGPVANPTTLWSSTVAAGGGALMAYDSTSMALRRTTSVGGAISSSPFVDPQGNALFAAGDHKLYTINAFNGAKTTPVDLPRMSMPDNVDNGQQPAKITPPVINGSAVVGNNYTAVGGGDEPVVFLVPKAGGPATFIGVNEAVFGCVSGSDGRIYFTSADGSLYVVD